MKRDMDLIARHGREGNDPTREEAILVVGVSAKLAICLPDKTAE
ncbi:hypothetical protein [Planctomicrobium sp. SH527]